MLVARWRSAAPADATIEFETRSDLDVAKRDAYEAAQTVKCLGGTGVMSVWSSGKVLYQYRVEDGAVFGEKV